MQKVKQFLFQNKTTKQTFAKNTFWLFFGDIMGRLLKLIVVVFATRVLGVEGWGVFAYALAFVSLFYALADIGINTFITREMSRGGIDKYHYLSASLVLKLFLLGFSFLISLICIPYIGNIALSIKIIIALGLLNFSDSIREFALSVNRALEKMEREAFIKIIMNVITTSLGIMLLVFYTDPLSLAIAYAVGSIIATGITFWLVWPEFRKITWKFTGKSLRTIFDFAWPFIAITLFSTAIASIDSIMLGQMKSAADVGLYAAAQRLVQFLAIIPIFIAASVFPIMAKAYGDEESSTRIFEKIMTTTLALGIPIAIGGFIFSSPIITLIFGSDYSAGGMVLGILMLSILAVFPNIILDNSIFTRNLQRKFIGATAVGLLGNIIINLYLIPRYGALGAAVSTVVTQLLIMSFNWHYLKRFFHFSIINRLWIIMIANAIMLGVIVIGNILNIYFVVTILISMCIYIGALYLLKEPLIQEIQSIIKIH